jgi:hypothetical protein
VTAAAALLSIATVVAIPAPASAAPLGSPENVTATPGRRLIQVNWQAPTTPGGTINRYRATATGTGGGSCDAAAGQTTCTISSVAANTPYTVTVVACPNPSDDTDCSAPGSAAGPVTAGPPAAPNAPTVAFQDTPLKVRLTWTDNDPGAGIASYKVTPSPATNLTGTCTALVTTHTCDYETLTADTAYTFRLTAIGVTNTTGTTGTSPLGAASAPKVAGSPHQVAKPTVSRDSNTAVTVSFDKPAGGQTLLGYTVAGTSTNGGAPVTCSAAPGATECKVTGLDQTKTYTFTVVARGEDATAGDAAPSPASDPITPGLPLVPSTPTVELGAVAGQVTVRWDPADVIAGGTPTSYSVTSEAVDAGTPLTGCTGLSGSATSCDFTGLQNGKKYRFKVTATNGAGSVVSGWSDAIVSQLPDAPAAPTVVLGDAPGKVNLTWPAATTGGPVVFYNVTAIPASGGSTGTKSAGCGFNLTTPACVITGLSTNQTYTFTVTAVGDLGTAVSAASAPILPDAPGAPQTPVVVKTGNSGEANVTWTAPTGGGAVASYTVTATEAGGSSTTGACGSLSSNATSCLFTGLDTTKPHTFTVKATNPAGDSTVTAAVTTPAIPSAPQTPTAVVGDASGKVVVSWTAPATGTAERYIVTATSTDASAIIPANPCVDAVPNRNCTITNLSPDKPYRFTVRAQNLLGGTDASPTAAIVPDKPGAPTSVAMTVTGSGAATVTWSPPTTGGPVASYTVTATSPDSGTLPSESPCTVAASATLSCAFTAMAIDKAYQFTVRAVNAVDGTDAAPTTAVVPAAPAAPAGVQAVLGDAPGKVTVTWNAPTGGAVTTYTVTPQSVTPQATVPAACSRTVAQTRECVFTGLTPTASYTFVARAANAVGGNDAGATGALIPDVPGQPTGVNVALGTGTPGAVTVTWNAPGGGGDPASYSVTPVSTTVGANVPTACTVLANATKTCSFTGLTTTATYAFEVRAINTAGPSSPATVSSVVPNLPGAATNLVVTLGATPGDATVTWDPPAAGGGAVTSYTASASSTAGGSPATPTPCTVAANATLTCTLTGMTTSAPYTFKVRATNASGDTDATTPAIVPNLAGMPTSVAAVLGDQPGKMTVTWTAPTDLGPALTTTVTASSPDGGALPSVCSKGPNDPTSCTFTGLDVTKTYRFTVRAANPSGGTSASATPAIKPNKPGAPTSVTAVRVLGAGKATVSWAVPTDLGVPASYLVTATPAGGGTATTCTKLSTDPATCALTGLDVTKVYSFKVKAINPSGDSEASAAETFIPNTPAKPTNVVVTPDNAAPGKVTVTWDQPAGADVTTGWVVTATSPDGGTLPSPCSKGLNDPKSCVFSGLTTVASYSFTVRASNEAGDSDSDSTVPVVPNRPNAPGAPTAQPIANTTARIAWTAPTGGSKITNYTVQAYTTGAPNVAVSSAACTGVTGLTCDFDGLTSTETYTFAVTASGPGGTAVSDRSAAVIMAGPGKPGTPTVALEGPDAVRVTWTAPTTGGPVTGYSVTSSPDLSAPARCTNTLALTCVFDRLTSGTEYKFSVVASGSAGRTATSDASVGIVPGLPGKPERVTAALTGDETKVKVSWSAPSGGQVTGYTVRAYTAGAPDVAVTSAACNGVTALTCDFGGLIPTETYTFTVTATGSAGTVVSDRTAAISTGGPGKPGKPTVELSGADGVKVTWTAASGPVTGYSVTASPDVSAPARCTGTLALTCVFDHLATGTPYTFTVTAAASAGRTNSSDASASITIPAMPARPERVTAALTGDETKVKVSWSAPSGGQVTGYTVQAYTAGAPDVAVTSAACNGVTALTCDFGGLIPTETYTFTVTATGPAGTAVSQRSASIITGGPGKPGKPTVELAGADAVRVSWGAATGPVTGYSVTASPDVSAPARCTNTLATSCLFDHLATGTPYTFMVTATASAGRTADSDSSASITIPGLPGKPERVTVALTGDDSKVKVSWTAPSGGPVTGYTVRAYTAGAPNDAVTSAACNGITAVTCDFGGLIPTETYTFTVTATGPAGTAMSDRSAAIITGGPGKPGKPAVELAGADAVKVTWTAASGPVTGYSVTSSPDVSAPARCTNTLATTCVFDHLGTGTPYTFTVTAAASAGRTNSSDASASITIPGLPGKPERVSAALTSDETKVKVSWSAPSGGPVTGYTVRAYTAGAPDVAVTSAACNGITAVTCDFGGLLPTETYTFTVTATGPAGTAVSDRSATIITGGPGKPGKPTVTMAGANAVTVSWAPASGPVTGYSVTSNPDASAPARCTNTLATTCVFDRLSTGTSYTFMVTAAGSGGRTAESDSSASITIPAMAGTPERVTATPTNDETMVRVSWQAPSQGGPVGGYLVQSTPDQLGCAEPAGADATFCLVTVDPKKTYTFRVKAVGLVGGSDSPFSPATDAVASGNPGQPGTPAVDLAGPNAVTVSWDAPEGGGPVTGYSVVSTPRLSAPPRCTDTLALSCVFDRLVSGTSYTFTVVATGSAGRVTPSEPSEAIIPGPPGVPERVTAARTAGDTDLLVSWRAPLTGGEITGYTVESTPGKADCATPAGPTATSCVVSGLDAKTSYTFRVKAVGPAGGGDSAFSRASDGITPGTPEVPTAPARPSDVDVAAGNGQIAVSWTAPANAAEWVDHYVATTNSGQSCATTTATDTECVISKLTNLTSYTVTVVAMRIGGGSSPASEPSARVRPTAGVPGSPTGVVAVSKDRSAVVTWKAPTTGSPVARYEVTAATATDSHTCPTDGSTLTCTVTDLTNGQQYSITVVAVGRSASGYSAPSTAVLVTPVKPPNTPTNVSVTTSAVKTLEVKWTSGGGESLGGFTATATNAGGTAAPSCTAASTATGCTITNVTPGPYSVSVVANSTFAGVTSTPSQAVTATALNGIAPALPASAPTTTVTLSAASPATGKVGTNVTISGNGFAAYTEIALGLYSTSPLVKLTPNAVTDATGAFSVVVTIPTGVTTGAKTVMAAGLPTGSTTVRYAKTTFTVS